jgi:hypothetical protein
VSVLIPAAAIDATDSVWGALNKIAWFSNVPVGRWWKQYYKRDLPSSQRRNRPPYVWLADFSWRRDGPEAELDGLLLQIALQRRMNRFDPLTAASTLKTCPACIAKGTHSVVHEPEVVAQCIVHDLPLVPGCPRCGARVELREGTVLQWGPAFACASCQRETEDRWCPLSEPSGRKAHREAADTLAAWGRSTRQYAWPGDLRGLRQGHDASLVRHDAFALVAEQILPFARPGAFGAPLRDCRAIVRPPPLTLHTDDRLFAGISRRKVELQIQEWVDAGARDIRSRLGKAHPCLNPDAGLGPFRDGVANARPGLSGLPCPVRVAFDLWRESTSRLIAGLAPASTPIRLECHVPHGELRALLLTEFYLLASSLLDVATDTWNGAVTPFTARWPLRIEWIDFIAGDPSPDKPKVYLLVDYSGLLDSTPCRAC